MNELENIDFVFSKEFRETKEFKDWYNSFNDLIKLFLEVRKYESIKNKSDNFKDLVYVMEGKHLLRSVELGIYYTKLKEIEKK